MAAMKYAGAQTVRELMSHYVSYGIEYPVSGDTLTLAGVKPRNDRRYVPPVVEGLTAGTRFRIGDGGQIPAHYTTDGDYVHGACLLTFLEEQHEAMGEDPETFDPDKVWTTLVEVGAWTVLTRSDLDVDDPMPIECIVCEHVIFLPAE